MHDMSGLRRIIVEAIQALKERKDRASLRRLEILRAVLLADAGDPSALNAICPTGHVLVYTGDYAGQKISVIKGIRDVTGLGLKEAKDLSEAHGETVLFAGNLVEATRRLKKARGYGVPEQSFRVRPA